MEETPIYVDPNIEITSVAPIIRVLHLDDEEQQQMFLKVFVEGDPNIKVTSARNAENTLELVQTGAYDCLISDYDMPDTDGITLAKKIRETSDIPIIIYTGRGSEEVAEKAYSAGINDYIRKENHPAHYQVLAKRIRHAVEKRRDEEEVIRLATFPRLNPNPVVEVDLTGKIHYMNPAARARATLRSTFSR